MVDVLYEDVDILAVDKPEGLVAVPDRRRLDPSLLEMLCTERGEKLYIVHRIDRYPELFHFILENLVPRDKN